MLDLLAWYDICACSVVVVISGDPLGPVQLDLAAPMTEVDRWIALRKVTLDKHCCMDSPRVYPCTGCIRKACRAMRPVVATLLMIMRTLYSWYPSSSDFGPTIYHSVPVRLAMTCSMKA